MDTINPELTQSFENGLFGLPSTQGQAPLVLLNIPWEVTTSYGSGASLGPEAILKASPQIDLFSTEFKKHITNGVFFQPPLYEAKNNNNTYKELAEAIIKDLEKNGALTESLLKAQSRVNEACDSLNRSIYEEAKKLLDQNKFVGLVGGDHSCPLGLIKALGEKYSENFGILHLDAHHDLRNAYQGFKYSHASIMYNAITLNKPPAQLTQVGIRDFSESEYLFAKDTPSITTFYDQKIKDQLFEGRHFKSICDEITLTLPEHVYISFDIDALNPELCPHTGTPVPGGLSFEQACYLIKTIVHSGKKIIGFDLCEVAPGPAPSEFDGNVGARILFQLCSWMLESQNN